MRVLVFKNVDPCFDALAEYLNAMGHEAAVLNNQSSQGEMINVIANFAPDFILLNSPDIFGLATRVDGPEIEDLFNCIDVPIVIWDFEAPYFTGGPMMCGRWAKKAYVRNMFIFTMDSFWVEQYRAVGIASDFLPFAIDPRMESFKPDASLESALQADVCYIGTAFYPKSTPQLEVGRAAHIEFFLMKIREKLVTLLEKWIGQQEGVADRIVAIDEKMVPAMLELFSKDVDDPVLYQHLDQALISHWFEETLKVFPSLKAFRALIEPMALAHFRLGYSFYQTTTRLDRLVDQGLRLYGEGGWNSLLPRYSQPTRRLSYPELFAAYRASKVIFNYTKKLFINNVHERVVHVLGTGGFPVIDHRGDIDRMFKPGEVITYRTMEEAQDLIRYYTKHETERMQVIERGRRRVYAEHTYVHRLNKLLEVVCKYYNLKQSPHRVQVPVSTANWIEAISHIPKVPQDASSPTV